ncbi:LpqB family beta-propeller domain-containing protein [Kineococcus auxinigenes]|uniref:LpqB family beta-propeller domain-containing protein n=1 Tax=unclassified Kineococcus TaxID=2621656 RepID=UPI003D7CFFF0
MSGTGARGARPPRRAVVVLALAAATGCAGLPRSGPVVAGSRVQADPRLGLLQVVPKGPVDGAGPVEVVRGFLLAAAAGAAEKAVAREFLSVPARRTWRPDVSTTVLGEDPAVELTDGPHPDGTASVRVSAPALADVDAGGRYAQRPPGARLERTLHLVREDGCWRVDVPGDGLLLTQLDAARSLRPFPVHFATTAGAAQLVGDVRWFAYDSSTATRVVTELLAGPSAWLAPAVRSGAPAGTGLRTGTVPLSGAVAVVDLTAPALRTTPEQRALLLAQLRAGLTRLPGVEEVAVRVEGAELTREAGPSPLGDPPGAPPVPDPRLVLAGPAGPSRWAAGAVRPVQGLSAPGAAAGVEHPAAAGDGSCWAWLVRGGATLVVQRSAAGGAGPAVSLGAGSVAGAAQGFAPPSIDRHGWVWAVPSAPGAAPAVLPSADPRTAPSAVEPPAGGLGGRVVRARASREGARLLVLAEDGEGVVRVRVHAVVRGADGRPARLGAPSPELVPGAGRVLDASWLGQDRVAVLVRPAGEDPVVLLVQVLGPSRRLAPVPGAESVAAGASEHDLVVGTADGRLLVRSGAGWSPLAPGRHPSYPG